MPTSPVTLNELRGPSALYVVEASEAGFTLVRSLTGDEQAFQDFVRETINC